MIDHTANAYTVAHSHALVNLTHLLENLDPSQPLVLHFPTPTKLGDHYLSALVYRHPQQVVVEHMHKNAIDPEPIVPLFHFIHQEKTPETFTTFFDTIKQFMEKKCPKFNEHTKVLVSDRKFRLEFLPNTHRVYCRQNIMNDLKREADAVGTKNVDFFLSSVSSLMNSETLSEYYSDRDQLFSTNPHWTSVKGRRLATNYKDRMEQDIIERAGYWRLKSLGLHQYVNGINNNPSRTYVRRLSEIRPKENEEQTADVTCIKLFCFESLRHLLVMLAYFGRGLFRMKPDYEHLDEPDDGAARSCRNSEDLQKLFQEKLSLQAP